MRRRSAVSKFFSLLTRLIGTGRLQGTGEQKDVYVSHRILGPMPADITIMHGTRKRLNRPRDSLSDRGFGQSSAWKYLAR